MLQISFSHFVLGIVVLLLALKDCDAFSNRGIIKKVVVEAGNGVILQGRKEMHKAKEIYVDNSRDAEETSGMLGGRKMMMERRELSNEVKKEESKKTSEEASRISGRKNMAKSLKKPPEESKEHIDDQNGSQLKANSNNDASSETSVQQPNDHPNSDRLCSEECASDSTSCSLKCSSESKNSVSKMSDQDSFQKLDSEKLLEAATQMVNLMNKDYPGGGGARHKPPINNREPLH